MRSTSAGLRWQRTASAPTSSATRRVGQVLRSHREPSTSASTRAWGVGWAGGWGGSGDVRERLLGRVQGLPRCAVLALQSVAS